MSDDIKERTKFELETEVDISFDSDDICRQLPPLQVVDLIKDLDDDVGIWEVTELLHRHFAEEHENAPFDVRNMSTADLIATLIKKGTTPNE